MLDYNDRAVIQANKNSARFHTSGCLSHSVDAFCDGLPDPGCTCSGASRIAARNADVVGQAILRAHDRDDALLGWLPDRAERDAIQALIDADLETAIFNDPSEQDRLDYESDLRYEYSKPEYHDEELSR